MSYSYQSMAELLPDNPEVAVEHSYEGDVYANAISSSVDEPLQQHRSIHVTAFTQETMYRCAHCSFVHDNQATVVAHAKSCRVLGSTSMTETTFAVEAIKDILSLDVDTAKISVNSDPDNNNTCFMKEDGEPVRRGKGLKLWTDKKIRVLLSGIMENATIFSENLKQIRRGWKLVALYTREHAKFRVNPRHCAYKWEKLLTEYQTYMAEPHNMKVPPYWKQVHAIVCTNQQILKKPDISCYIKTLTKVPANVISYAEVATNTAADRSVITKDYGNDIEQYDATLAINNQMSDESLDCAKIQITEGSFMEMENVQNFSTLMKRMTCTTACGGDGCNGDDKKNDEMLRLGKGGLRVKIWTSERVGIFLNVLDKNRQLLSRNTPFMIKYAWSIIAAETAKLGNFYITGVQCCQKWKNMVWAFVKRRHFTTPEDCDHPLAGHHAATVCALHRKLMNGSQSRTPIRRAAAESDSENACEDDDKCDNLDLQRAFEEHATRNGERRGPGGYRLLFWTEGRLCLLVETVLQHCYLLDTPGSKPRAAWRIIAAAVSERGHFTVDYDRCVRKFRQLVMRFVFSRSNYRPSYYADLIRVVERLPAFSSSLPQKMMREAIKTGRFVDVSKKNHCVSVVNRLEDLPEEAPFQHIEDDCSVDNEEEATDSDRVSCSGSQLKASDNLGVRSNRKRRDVDTSDCQDEVQAEDHLNEVNTFVKPTSSSRKKRKISEGKTKSNCRSGTVLGDSAVTVLERMERSMYRHQVRVERSLDLLTSTLSSIDQSIKKGSDDMHSFLAGFAKSFASLVNNRTKPPVVLDDSD